MPYRRNQQNKFQQLERTRESMLQLKMIIDGIN